MATIEIDDWDDQAIDPQDIKPGMYLRQLNDKGEGIRGRCYRVIATDRRWALLVVYLDLFSDPHNPDQFDLTKTQFESVDRNMLVAAMGSEKVARFDAFCEERYLLYCYHQTRETYDENSVSCAEAEW